MKRTITIVMAFFLLAVAPSVLGAGEPELISTWQLYGDLDGSSPGDQNATAVYGVEVFGNKLATVTPIDEGNNYRLYLQIYNLGGGLSFLDNVTVSCGGTGTTSFNGANLNPKYIENGLLLFGASTGCSGAFYGRGTTAVYDVSSSLFTEYDGGLNSYQTTPTSPGGSNAVPMWTGSEAFEFLAGTNYFEYNGTGFINYEDTLTMAKYPDDEDFVDYQNNVFIDRGGYDEFYEYLDENFDDLDAMTLLDQSPSAVVDWNRNPNNPEFLLANNRIMIVGGSNYNNFQTSSYQIPFNALYMFERSNIIGTDGNYWAWADLENLSSPTNGTGTNPINADYIWREGNNIIVTYNSTTRMISVYEVPLPDFFEFITEGVNTAPYHDDLEFLGIDISDRFIFKNTVTDDEGGFISQAQQLNFASEDIEDLVIENNIEFDSPEEEDYAEDDSFINTISLYDEQPKHKVGTDFGSESLRYKVEFVSPMTITIPQPVTASDTDLVGTVLEFTYDEEKLFYQNSANLHTSVEFLDQDGRQLLHLLIERFNDNDTAYLYDLTGGQTLLAELNLSGKEDYFRFYNNFDFVGGTAEIILLTDQELYNEVLNFSNPLAFGFGAVRFLDSGNANIFGDQFLYVDKLGYAYERGSIIYPEYELLGQFDEGETQVFATSLPSSGYGNYILYSWLTDNTLGDDNYDYLTTLSFTHDNSTEVLDQNAINQIIADAQSQVEQDAGFNTPDFVEGDLVTDTFFGYLDSWNIKSTASKFFAGLVIIILFIGVGGWMGVQLKSPIVSTLGAMFGGIGAIFLVTYWGLFPAWVSFTIVLIVISVVANMIRNSLTGRGGS